jgi:hypothetical protein
MREILRKCCAQHISGTAHINDTSRARSQYLTKAARKIFVITAAKKKFVITV